MTHTLLLLLCVGALAVPGRAAVRSEARIYASRPAELREKLGTMTGELDVCTAGQDETGRCYLVVNADEDEIEAIRARGVEVEVTWPDIRDKFRAMTGCEPDGGSFRDFGYFFTYWEMADTLAALAAAHPAIVHVDTSMRSYHGRALWCVRVSDNAATDEPEPEVFFNGATHAREPLSTHTCIEFATLLCEGYGSDSLVTWLVDNREMYFVPVMNPDGYVYNSDSGGASSNWRKNRRMIQSPYIGVDLNRNYGYRWGCDDLGSSPNPSSETYRGPARFSEPAVEAIHQFEAAHRFRAQLDFHTYGRYNLYPWAYDGAEPPELELLQEIADTFQANNGYSRTGQWYYTLYVSNGTSIDWEFVDTLDNGIPKFTSYAFSCELGTTDFWYGATNPAYVDAEVALNIPNCYYLTRLCGAWLEPVRVVVDDSATGNGTGELDPGETAEVWFEVRNRALHALDTARSVTAVLASADSIVQVLVPGTSFPDIPRRSPADNSGAPLVLSCRPEAVPGTVVGLRLEVTFADAGATIVQPLACSITIGDHPQAVAEAPPGGGLPRLLVRPVPAGPGREVRFEVTGATAGSGLGIFTRDGGLIAEAALVNTGDGRLVFVWDGRDRSRQPVPAGVYFARLESSAGPVVAKALVVGR